MNALVLTSLVLLLLVFVTLSGTTNTGSDVTLLRQIRNVRGRNNANKSKTSTGSDVVACRYTKGTWSECDPSSNLRTRTLTLKRGAQDACEATKTETRKCKKACRYVKGQWSECDGSAHMKERLDQLKNGSDPSCEPTRRMTKKCKGSGGSGNKFGGGANKKQ